jgi:hypothetical protein
MLQYLPNVSASNPGKKINFVENRQASRTSSGQFSPYSGWGCDFTAGRYLFRAVAGT